MKVKMMAILVLTGVLAAPVMATDVRPPGDQSSSTPPTFAADEVRALFAPTAQAAQFAILTPHEMRHTQGARLWGSAMIGSAGLTFSPGLTDGRKRVGVPIPNWLVR